jgi:hypothetical protein
MELPLALANDVQEAISIEVLLGTVKSNLPEEANIRRLREAPPKLGLG